MKAADYFNGNDNAPCYKSGVSGRTLFNSRKPGVPDRKSPHVSNSRNETLNR